MLLKDYLKDKGGLLFRYRSITPLLLIPLFIAEKNHLGYPLDNPFWGMVYVLSCLAVSSIGIIIRVKTIGHIPKGTSGRNTTAQKAEVLNTTGIYSVVRNPLYLGNYFIFTGITLLMYSWELFLLNQFFFAASYIPIILAEEDFLLEKFGQSYVTYTSQVPCFIPRFSGWQTPEIPFNLRMVLRREHDTLLAVVLVFVMIEHFREYVITGRIELQMGWILFGGITLLFCLTLKILKKFTKVLKATPVPDHSPK